MHAIDPTKPRKIAIISPSLDAGGGERVFINLANEFVEQGIPVELVVFRSGGELAALLDKRVQVIDLNTRLRSSFMPIRKYLKQQAPPVIISGPQYLNFMVILANRFAGRKTKVIATHHNFHDAELKKLGLIGRLSTFLLRTLYPLAFKVVAVSDGLKKYLAEDIKIRPDNIVRIYNPVVNPALYQLANQEPAHNWFTGTNRPEVIISVGRLVTVKNFRSLINAFALIRDKTTASLVIIGNGPEMTDLKTLVADLGLQDRIQIPGSMANPYAYIARSQLLVVPSNSETFSIAIVEALALGIPVVSTDTIGATEVLANGEFGKLVPIGNVAALAEGMVYALNNKQDPAKIRQRAQDFTAQRISMEYLKLTE